jgi:hypothetical protein
VKFIIIRKVVTLQPWEQIEIECCQIKHGLSWRHWFSLLEVCILVEELCLIVQCKYIFMDSTVEFLNARSQCRLLHLNDLHLLFHLHEQFDLGWLILAASTAHLPWIVIHPSATCAIWKLLFFSNTLIHQFWSFP